MRSWAKKYCNIVDNQGGYIYASFSGIRDYLLWIPHLRYRRHMAEQEGSVLDSRLRFINLNLDLKPDFHPLLFSAANLRPTR